MGENRLRSDSDRSAAMTRDFFDPPPEQQNVVLINAATLHEAERLIDSCEGCNPDGAKIPLDVILDRVTGQIRPSLIMFWKRRRSARIAAVRFWKRLSSNWRKLPTHAPSRQFRLTRHFLVTRKTKLRAKSMSLNVRRHQPRVARDFHVAQISRFGRVPPNWAVIVLVCNIRPFIFRFSSVVRASALEKTSTSIVRVVVTNPF
jgi:hypothetical protein